MKTCLRITMNRELLQTILEGARRLYPREVILLLRGKRRKDVIEITDLLVPPLARYGRGFAEIRLHMMPTDFSIVGTVHSHASGNLTPSNTDLNHLFGAILMIAAFPFADERNIAAYNHDGEKLTLQIEER
jgi:proteasome lid subunit RPN8/RPN11